MIKPPIITQDQVIHQIQEIPPIMKEHQHQFEQLEKKLASVKTALEESDLLRHQVKELAQKSYDFFLEEWKRKSTYYPDIHLHLLEKAIQSKS